MFDNAKQIRYQWFLKDFNNEISKTKAKKVVRFNERYNALTHFVLKDNKLYRRAFKVGQQKKLIVYNYSARNIIKKIHT